jgi:hypothetical protein
MSKPPLRPATQMDPELARPDEDTEIGKANKLAEKGKKPAHEVDIEEEASPRSKQPK